MNIIKNLLSTFMPILLVSCVVRTGGVKIAADVEAMSAVHSAREAVKAVTYRDSVAQARIDSALIARNLEVHMEYEEDFDMKTVWETDSVRTKDPAAAVPRGYKIVEKFFGDLNGDGLDDCVLLVKGTDRTILDRGDFEPWDLNRRGLHIFFKTGDDMYEGRIKNYSCFPGQAEYYMNQAAPELSIVIKRGNLCISHGEGRWSFASTWKYIFSYIGQDFYLIGYEDRLDCWGTPQDGTSIDFQTRRIKSWENVNGDTGDPDLTKIKNKWGNIEVDSLLKITDINNFFNVHEMSKCFKVL